MTIEPEASRRATTELHLSVVLEGCDGALANSAGIADLHLMDLDDLAEALARLRGVDGPGIISYLQMIARAIEDTIVAKVDQKWTVVDGFRLERIPGGKWTIDSRAALRRIFTDYGDETIRITDAVDAVLNHISGLDTSWRTTELEDTLGGKIVTQEPVLKDGEPVILTRGPRKGQPKLREVKRSPIVEYELGDRDEGRTTVRIHKGEATDG